MSNENTTDLSGKPMLTEAEKLECRSGRPILAIKSLRDRLGIGLKEAKDIVDGEIWKVSVGEEDFPPDDVRMAQSIPVFLSLHPTVQRSILRSIAATRKDERNKSADLLMAHAVVDGLVPETANVLLEAAEVVRTGRAP